QVIKQELRKYLTAEQRPAYGKLRREQDRLRRLPEPPRDLALSVHNCLVRPPDTHVMVRGNPHVPGAKVQPGFPAVLGAPDPELPQPGPGARTSGRRSLLARWITAPDNPLPARVLANRLWQHHFGRGIVASPNDFGKFGTPPTHPELLDWLADELV